MFIWPNTSESSVLTISCTIFIHIIYVIVWFVIYGLFKDCFSSSLRVMGSSLNAPFSIKLEQFGLFQDIFVLVLKWALPLLVKGDVAYVCAPIGILFLRLACSQSVTSTANQI